MLPRIDRVFYVTLTEPASMYFTRNCNTTATYPAPHLVLLLVDLGVAE